MIFLLFLSFVSTLAYGVQTGRITPPNNGTHSNVYSLPGFTYKTCASNSQCGVVELLHAGYHVDIEEIIDLEGIPGAKGSVRYYKVLIFSDGPLKIGYVPASYITLNESLTSPCQKRKYSDFVKEMQVITEQAKPKPRPKPVSTAVIPSLEDPKFNGECKNIIDENGQIGSWGRIALRAFEKAGVDCFYNKLDVSNVCPKFKNFSHVKKTQFLLYTLASMAMKESSCDPTEDDSDMPHKQVNGIADGLFGLEYSREWRKIRDPDLCKSTQPYNTKELQFQFECTASMIRDLHCKKNRPLVSSDTYWNGMLSTDRRIAVWIKEFPGCF